MINPMEVYDSQDIEKPKRVATEKQRAVLHRIGRKKGDPQTPMMQLSSKLSWIRFQLKAMGSNACAAQNKVTREDYDQLRLVKQQELKELLAQVNEFGKLASELADEVARFNRDKKKHTV